MAQEGYFIGEIRMFGGNFAPRGWALCDGQLLAISQNTALFSILGTTYGGDGRTTFALPDLRGRLAMHAGTGPGLSTRKLGARTGLETNTLNINQLAFHNHLAGVSSLTGTGAITGTATMTVDTTSDNSTSVSNNPNGKILTVADDSAGDQANYVSTGTEDGALPSEPVDFTNTMVNINAIGGTITVGNTGNQQPLNNLQPAEVVNFIIQLYGIYPSRS